MAPTACESLQPQVDWGPEGKPVCVRLLLSLPTKAPIIVDPVIVIATGPRPESEDVVTLPAPLALWGRPVSQTAPHSQVPPQCVRV